MHPPRKAKQRVLDSLDRDRKGRRNNGKEKRDRKVEESLNFSDSKANKDCVICMERVVIRGSLSRCDHWFCFTCIHEWSKRTNTCPLCKVRFRCITKKSKDGWGKDDKTFRIKDKEQSFMNSTQDDYDVAMGLLSESETSDDDEDSDSDYSDINTDRINALLIQATAHVRVQSTNGIRSSRRFGVPLTVPGIEEGGSHSQHSQHTAQDNTGYEFEEDNVTNTFDARSTTSTNASVSTNATISTNVTRGERSGGETETENESADPSSDETTRSGSFIIESSDHQVTSSSDSSDSKSIPEPARKRTRATSTLQRPRREGATTRKGATTQNTRRASDSRTATRPTATRPTTNASSRTSRTSSTVGQTRESSRSQTALGTSTISRVSERTSTRTSHKPERTSARTSRPERTSTRTSRPERNTASQRSVDSTDGWIDMSFKSGPRGTSQRTRKISESSESCARSGSSSTTRHLQGKATAAKPPNKSAAARETEKRNRAMSESSESTISSRHTTNSQNDNNVPGCSSSRSGRKHGTQRNSRCPRAMSESSQSTIVSESSRHTTTNAPGGSSSRSGRKLRGKVATKSPLKYTERWNYSSDDDRPLRPIRSAKIETLRKLKTHSEQSAENLRFLQTQTNLGPSVNAWVNGTSIPRFAKTKAMEKLENRNTPPSTSIPRFAKTKAFEKLEKRNIPPSTSSIDSTVEEVVNDTRCESPVLFEMEPESPLSQRLHVSSSDECVSKDCGNIVRNGRRNSGNNISNISPIKKNSPRKKKNQRISESDEDVSSSNDINNLSPIKRKTPRKKKNQRIAESDEDENSDGSMADSDDDLPLAKLSPSSVSEEKPQSSKANNHRKPPKPQNTTDRMHKSKTLHPHNSIASNASVSSFDEDLTVNSRTLRKKENLNDAVYESGSGNEDTTCSGKPVDSSSDDDLPLAKLSPPSVSDEKPQSSKTNKHRKPRNTTDTIHKSKTLHPPDEEKENILQGLLDDSIASNVGASRCIIPKASPVKRRFKFASSAPRFSNLKNKAHV